MAQDTQLPPIKGANKMGSIVVAAQRNSIFGWIVAIVMMVLFLIQSLAISLKPNEVLAVDDQGRVVGKVLFDEAFYRSETEVIADLKNWVRNCNSVSRHTIMEDTQVCLNHMQSDLAETRLQELLATNFVISVEQNGCTKTDYNFNNDEIKIDIDREELTFKAQVGGEVVCHDSGSPERQAFLHLIQGSLVDRTTNKPLAINVNKIGDL